MAFDTTDDRGFFSRHRYWFFGALALGAASFYGYRETRPLPVAVIEARNGPAERVLAISGRTRPQVTVTIVPKFAGQIVKLTRDEGEKVNAGDLLVQLEAEAPRAAVEEAESKIASQQRAVAEAQRNFERLAQLKERGLATVKEFDQSRFELDQSRAELVRLAANRREVSARLRDNTIVAPVSGVILARPVDQGQVVATTTVIYEIAPLAGVEIETDIDEQFLAEVREGMKADVLIAGLPKSVAATLYYVSPKVDPRTGGAKARLRLDSPVEGLRAGVTADVNLIIERRDAAITVARSAILGREQGARVQIVSNGIVEEKKVQFLEWPSERVIVVAGLESGQQLVAQPRAELVGKRVAPTTDYSQLRPGDRPRGSAAGRAI